MGSWAGVVYGSYDDSKNVTADEVYHVLSAYRFSDAVARIIMQRSMLANSALNEHCTIVIEMSSLNPH